MIIHIPPGLRGLWRRKRSQSPRLPLQVFSGRPSQSIRVGREQSASPPPPCPVGQGVEKRGATAPRAAPPPNTERGRTRGAAHVMARWVWVTLSPGFNCLYEYPASTGFCRVWAFILPTAVCWGKVVAKGRRRGGGDLSFTGVGYYIITNVCSLSM